MTHFSLSRRNACGLAFAATAAALGSAAAVGRERKVSPSERRRAALARVANWGIHLRKHDTPGIAAAPFDLMVIDYAPYRHLTFEFPFSAGEVAAMQRKADGSRRLVLAYLSIGEAEDYRYYWRREWNDAAPEWIAPENTAWPGNFPVQFWRPEWQRLLFKAADSYQEWQPKYARAEAQMIRLIGELCEAARRRNPEFLMVLQNAEELMRHASVRQAVDAIAKEDLFYGAETSGAANKPEMVDASLAHLRRARRAGLKVLVLEYVAEPALAADARARALKEGFLPHFAERSLGTLTLKGPDEAAARP
jgi:cysteinyl-tRNA synthetase